MIKSRTTVEQKFVLVGNVSMSEIFCFADLNELNLPKTCSTEFPDPDDLLNFKLIICPDEGFYRGGRFVFSFKVK